MRRGFSHLEQYAFYLAREYIHATYYQHVVSTSCYLAHPDEGPSAVTFLIIQRGQVSCPVAYQRHAFFRDCGEDQFARRSGRKHFFCFRVDDLGYEMVFLYMETALAGTLGCNAWAYDFAEPVNIYCKYSQPSFYFIPHCLRPWLCSEHTGFQLQFAQLYACLFDL